MIYEIYIPKLKLNIKYLIGKNKEENFEIIDLSKDNDIWIHIYDYSSCHVIACVDELNINRKYLKYIIKQGALLCKQNSNLKSLNKVKIIYTKIKNVQKTEIIGMVLTKDTKIISI
jgi:hypothetical protein